MFPSSGDVVHNHPTGLVWAKKFPFLTSFLVLTKKKTPMRSGKLMGRVAQGSTEPLPQVWVYFSQSFVPPGRDSQRCSAAGAPLSQNPPHGTRPRVPSRSKTCGCSLTCRELLLTKKSYSHSRSMEKGSKNTCG